jgi:hypothetical protein
MRRTFNLAEWSINHRPFVTFVMIMLLAAGAWSYSRLGRAEDPPFTAGAHRDRCFPHRLAVGGAEAGQGKTHDVEDAQLGALHYVCRKILEFQCRGPVGELFRAERHGVWDDRHYWECRPPWA